ncbi:glycoside hydrolase family 88 protein, partial [Aaosphaeria arxii CBS 175.79]
SQLFDQSVEAKIWGIAVRGLNQPSPPVFFPEYTKPGGLHYVYRELDFWTSGFFPGSLHLLLERRRNHGSMIFPDDATTQSVHELHLEHACKVWTESLHQNALLRNTHDIGFMIMPWARPAYELNHDLRALETIKTAALSLYSRFDARIGCIRSWDTCVTKKYNFRDPRSEFMMIIDNMMNLDLLFYAASKTHNKEMHAAAVEHARTTMRTHIRADGSTTHLVVFDTNTGEIRQRLTNQGYSHTSCWSRGQAWAIAGFAETYMWTHEREFLDTARRCADHFLGRLAESNIVAWDFDAPETEGTKRPTDTSAAMIAAYGMVLIHKALLQTGETSDYLLAALKITNNVCANNINHKASFTATKHDIETVEHGSITNTTLGVDMGESETILNGATINNYEFAPRRWADHGLVYADYFFILLGNRLLDFGL